MKLSIHSFAIVAYANLAFTSPTPTELNAPARANIEKRATVTDVANLGYATQNGG